MPGKTTDNRKQTATTPPVPIAMLCRMLCTLLAVLLAAQTPSAHADAPQDIHSVLAYPPRHEAILLTAGDDGPFFSLDDLAAYRPLPTRTPTWKAKPVFLGQYPPEIESIPLVPRTYPTHTVAYLAAHEIRHGDRQSQTMALTFDCGAGTGSALQILDTLRQEQVTATFFVLGKYTYLFPDIVRQIAADGHEIGSHSFYHPAFTTIEPISATQEILYTESAIEWAVGRHIPMRYFRFPYGDRNDATRQHVASLGYQSAFWDIDPRGWDPQKTSEDVVQHVRDTAHSGGIVIMHCGSWDDARALPDVIRTIRELGMTPGTLTDVLTDQDRAVPDYP